MAGLSFPKLGLKTMFSIIQLVTETDWLLNMKKGGGATWKEGSRDPITLALRENSLMVQARVRQCFTMGLQECLAGGDRSRIFH